MQIHRISAGTKPDQMLDHERLSALINNMTDAVVAIDKSGIITLSNSVALSLLDVNSLTGRRLTEAFHLLDKDGRPVDVATSILANPASFSNNDWRLKYADGSTINLFFSSSPVRGGFGAAGTDGRVLLFRDITREKSVEEEREEFVSVASHELRTPIAIAEGNISNAQLLAERTTTPDTIKQSLAAAHDQIIFLSNLINDLSMLSRADRGKLALTIEQISVPELVNSLVHDYEPQAAKKDLSLKANLSPDVDTLVSSKLYVREVLQNFITNALKYTEKGGVILSATKINDGIEFMVIDTGIGISKSEQSKLFDKFFRSEDWRVKKLNGTGLGLYITSKLAKLVGGNIQMESQLNKGSSFKIYIPNSEPTAVKA
jgi:signal transduction histidine kinase